ncbi:MAG: FAD-dependent oxidoreductase, partial [Chloroflexota bacterium]
MKRERYASGKPHVVIVGGGFGGLYAAKALSGADVDVTLIDKRNFHLFQPLLYQVATGGLSPGDIASPLRSALKRAANVRVHKAKVVDIFPEKKQVLLSDGVARYDYLIVATGTLYNYFDHPEWADRAQSLKTIEDALTIRRRLLLAFEAAEREPSKEKREAWLNFVIVGGGPTGVELAGALGELAHTTLRGEFRDIDPAEAHITLLEATDSILPTYPAELSAKAARSLQRLGVTIRTRTLLTDIQAGQVILRDMEGGAEELMA